MKNIPLKKHLKNLVRVQNPDKTRMGYLRLDKNENIIPMSDSLIKQMQKQITSDFVSAYPEPGMLYKKIAASAKCKKENIYLSSGSDGAIKSVFEAFINKNDTVLLVSPNYAMFYVYAKMFSAKLKEIFYDKKLSITAEKITSKIKSTRPKLICISNPNSPTGAIIKSEDLKKIICQASKANSIILIDEAYHLFYPKSCIGLIPQYPNLVVTRTFSKAFGLASARLGYAVAHKKMIACLHKTRPMYETNAFAIKCAEIMLANKNAVNKNIAVAKRGKKYLETRLKRQGLRYFKSYANFVLIDMQSRKRALSAAKSLKKKKILVKSGFDFEPISGCIRINIGSVKHMKTFLGALERVIR